MSAWQYKLQVTFSGYGRSATLTNFPALVALNTNISGFAYSKVSSGTGADLRFVDSSNNELNYEIDTWNTNGTSYVWVQVPTLSGTNTYVSAYFGNPSATVPSYTTNGSTWANYAGVWHLSENPAGSAPQVKDSTANQNNGTSAGAMTSDDQVAGKVDGSLDFDGSGDYIEMSDHSSLDLTTVTLEVWAKFHTLTGYRRLLSKGDSSSCNYDIDKDTDTGKLRFVFKSGGTWNVATLQSSAFSANEWVHIAAVGRWSGTQTLVEIYVNGTKRTLNTSAFSYQMATGSQTLRIGSQQNDGNYFMDGLIDEARVSSVARSSNWVWACRQNMASNSAFNTYGQVTLATYVFVSGADAGGVTNDFLIGKDETTVSDYVAFLNANTNGEISVTNGQVKISATGNLLCLSTQSESTAYVAYNAAASPGQKFSAVSGRGSHPIVYVSWFGAAAYCNWKSSVDGFDAVYSPTNGWTATLSNYGFRLPTEAEWYKAAAWDAEEEVFKAYGTGANTVATNTANYLNSGDAGEANAVRTCPVGSSSALSFYCLRDASGNVWEWCHGFLDASGSDADVDAHAVRGGSWGNLAQDVKTGSRSGNKPGQTLNTVGFRIMRVSE